MSTVPTPPRMALHLVDAGEHIIRTFGGPTITRDRAEDLLRIWGHVSSLTPAEYAAVLDRFGPAPVHPAHDGYPIGGRR